MDKGRRAAGVVPRVGDGISIPGASAVGVRAVTWSSDLKSVTVTLNDCPRRMIGRVLATFEPTSKGTVERLLSRGLTDWVEAQGWSLNGPGGANEGVG